MGEVQEITRSMQVKRAGLRPISRFGGKKGRKF